MSGRLRRMKRGFVGGWLRMASRLVITTICRMSARRMAICAALVLSMALLTGCGASSTPRYITRANAVCASVKTRAASLAQELIDTAVSLGVSPGERATRHLASGLKRLDTTASDTLRRLRDLNLPAAEHPQLKRFLTVFASADAAVGRALAAAEAGHPQLALSDLKHIAVDVEQMSKAAKAARLTECEDALGAVP